MSTTNKIQIKVSEEDGVHLSNLTDQELFDHLSELDMMMGDEDLSDEDLEEINGSFEEGRSEMERRGL